VNKADAPVALGTVAGFQLGAEFHSPPLAPIQVVWPWATEAAPIRQPTAAQAMNRRDVFMSTPPNAGNDARKPVATQAVGGPIAGLPPNTADTLSE
jgi:hypothetical protein